MFLRKTPPLVKYAQQLFDPNKDKREEGKERLRNAKLRSALEAKGLIATLAGLSSVAGKERDDAVHAILGLLQSPESDEAREVIVEEGPAVLDKIARLLREDGYAWGLALKLLAAIGTREALRYWVDHFLAAEPQRRGYQCYIASLPLVTGEQVPHAAVLFPKLLAGLRDAKNRSLVVEIANNAVRHGDLTPHPLETHVDVLEDMLAPAFEETSDREDWESEAIDACAALAFIDSAKSKELLIRALRSGSRDVRIEAGFALAYQRDDRGTALLIQACLSPMTLKKSQEYLEELHLDHLVSEEARDPDMAALAEFANWLAHPNELGRPPDEVEIIDKRELAWPPDKESKPFRLIRYRARDKGGQDEDDVDCGLVGSMTFCLFSYKMAERPPEDCYAIYCYWEMEHEGLLTESDDPDEYQDLLSQWKGNQLADAKILAVAELSPTLNYPQRLVALASARRHGEEGWVVLDGKRSTWYPKSDMPEEAPADTVLMLHVGRRLLGFRGEPDRKEYLAAPRRPRSAEEIIQSYDKLFNQADKLTASKRQVAFDVFSPLGQQFLDYVDALRQVGSEEKAVPLIQFFEPFWDHNLGYETLGKAAYKCRRLELAEKFIEKLRESYEDSHRSEEMSLLAGIWVQQGRKEEARNLLTECLRKLATEAKKATGSDKRLYEDWFQHHRMTYLRLFPDLGDARLAQDGVRTSTLTSG